MLEPSISAHIEELIQGYDISHLEKVVITDEFVEDVLGFQREQHYLNPSVTDNDKARAFGKTLLNKDIGLQVVFIDSSMGTLLLDNYFFDTLSSSLSQDQDVERLMVHRKLANNILDHEMAHVEFDSLSTSHSFCAIHMPVRSHRLAGDSSTSTTSARRLLPLRAHQSFQTNPSTSSNSRRPSWLNVAATTS